MVQWYELKNREAIEQYEHGGGDVRLYQRSTQFDSISTETILHGCAAAHSVCPPYAVVWTSKCATTRERTTG